MRSGLEDQHLHTLALMEYFSPSILIFCAHTLQREASRLEMKCKYLRMRARLQGNGPNLLATASCRAICDRGALLLGVEAAHSASTRFVLRKSKTLINLCVFSYFFLEWEYPDGWKVIGKCRMRASCTSCVTSLGNEVTTQTSRDINEWRSENWSTQRSVQQDSLPWRMSSIPPVWCNVFVWQLPAIHNQRLLWLPAPRVKCCNASSLLRLPQKQLTDFCLLPRGTSARTAWKIAGFIRVH